MGIKDTLRRGKVHDIGAGIGGGVIAGAIISRVTPNPTYSTIGGAVGSYMWGGLWGLAGYLGLRFISGGIQLGGYNISAASLQGQARPGVAAGLGVQAI